MKAILTRAEAKDYLDIHALLEAGITLPQALGAAKAPYPEFNPALSVKALAYFAEPTRADVRQVLVRESAKVEAVEPLEKLASTIGMY